MDKSPKHDVEQNKQTMRIVQYNIMHVKFKNMQNLTVYYFQVSTRIYGYNMKTIKHAKSDEC